MLIYITCGMWKSACLWLYSSPPTKPCGLIWAQTVSLKPHQQSQSFLILPASVVCWYHLQTDWIQIRSDKMLGLIWISTDWHSADTPVRIFRKSWFWKRQKACNYQVVSSSLQNAFWASNLISCCFIVIQDSGLSWKWNIWQFSFTDIPGLNMFWSIRSQWKVCIYFFFKLFEY